MVEAFDGEIAWSLRRSHQSARFSKKLMVAADRAKELPKSDRNERTVTIILILRLTSIGPNAPRIDSQPIGLTRADARGTVAILSIGSSLFRRSVLRQLAPQEPCNQRRGQAKAWSGQDSPNDNRGSGVAKCDSPRPEPPVVAASAH